MHSSVHKSLLAALSHAALDADRPSTCCLAHATATAVHFTMSAHSADVAAVARAVTACTAQDLSLPAAQPSAAAATFPQLYDTEYLSITSSIETCVTHNQEQVKIPCASAVSGLDMPGHAADLQGEFAFTCTPTALPRAVVLALAIQMPKRAGNIQATARTAIWRVQAGAALGRAGVAMLGLGFSSFAIKDTTGTQIDCADPCLLGVTWRIDAAESRGMNPGGTLARVRLVYALPADLHALQLRCGAGADAGWTDLTVTGKLTTTCNSALVGEVLFAGLGCAAEADGAVDTSAWIAVPASPAALTAAVREVLAVALPQQAVVESLHQLDALVGEVAAVRAGSDMALGLEAPTTALRAALRASQAVLSHAADAPAQLKSALRGFRSWLLVRGSQACNLEELFQLLDVQQQAAQADDSPATRTLEAGVDMVLRAAAQSLRAASADELHAAAVQAGYAAGQRASMSKLQHLLHTDGPAALAAWHAPVTGPKVLESLGAAVQAPVLPRPDSIAERLDVAGDRDESAACGLVMPGALSGPDESNAVPLSKLQFKQGSSDFANVSFVTHEGRPGVLSSSNGYALMDMPIKQGDIAEWAWKVDEETDSQASCFGVARQPVRSHSYDGSPDLWHVRAYTAGRYWDRASHGTNGQHQTIHQNDRVRHQLDTVAATLKIWVNDVEQPGMAIHNVSPAHAEVDAMYPALCFYGGGRKITIQSFKWIKRATRSGISMPGLAGVRLTSAAVAQQAARALARCTAPASTGAQVLALQDVLAPADGSGTRQERIAERGMLFSTAVPHPGALGTRTGSVLKAAELGESRDPVIVWASSMVQSASHFLGADASLAAQLEELLPQVASAAPPAMAWRAMPSQLLNVQSHAPASADSVPPRLLVERALPLLPVQHVLPMLPALPGLHNALPGADTLPVAKPGGRQTSSTFEGAPGMPAAAQASLQLEAEAVLGGLDIPLQRKYTRFTASVCLSAGSVRQALGAWCSNSAGCALLRKLHAATPRLEQVLARATELADLEADPARTSVPAALRARSEALGALSDDPSAVREDVLGGAVYQSGGALARTDLPPVCILAEVWLDGACVWRSGPLTDVHTTYSVDISVVAAETLTLRAYAMDSVALAAWFRAAIAAARAGEPLPAPDCLRSTADMEADGAPAALSAINPLALPVWHTASLQRADAVLCARCGAWSQLGEQACGGELVPGVRCGAALHHEVHSEELRTATHASEHAADCGWDAVAVACRAALATLRELPGVSAALRTPLQPELLLGEDSAKLNEALDAALLGNAGAPRASAALLEHADTQAAARGLANKLAGSSPRSALRALVAAGSTAMAQGMQSLPALLRTAVALRALVKLGWHWCAAELQSRNAGEALAEFAWAATDDARAWPSWLSPSAGIAAACARIAEESRRGDVLAATLAWLKVARLSSTAVLQLAKHKFGQGKAQAYDEQARHLSASLMLSNPGSATTPELSIEHKLPRVQPPAAWKSALQAAAGTPGAMPAWGMLCIDARSLWATQVQVGGKPARLQLRPPSLLDMDVKRVTLQLSWLAPSIPASSPSAALSSLTLFQAMSDVVGAAWGSEESEAAAMTPAQKRSVASIMTSLHQTRLPATLFEPVLLRMQLLAAGGAAGMPAGTSCELTASWPSHAELALTLPESAQARAFVPALLHALVRAWAASVHGWLSSGVMEAVRRQALAAQAPLAASADAAAVAKHQAAVAERVAELTKELLDELADVALPVPSVHVVDGTVSQLLPGWQRLEHAAALTVHLHSS